MSETPKTRTSPLSRALVEELSAAAGEPAWLRERRLAAWEAFVRLPPPAAALSSSTSARLSGEVRVSGVSLTSALHLLEADPNSPRHPDPLGQVTPAAPCSATPASDTGR